MISRFYKTSHIYEGGIETVKNKKLCTNYTNIL